MHPMPGITWLPLSPKFTIQYLLHGIDWIFEAFIPSGEDNVELHQWRESEGPCRRAFLVPAAVFCVILPVAALSVSSMGVWHLLVPCPSCAHRGNYLLGTLQSWPLMDTVQSKSPAHVALRIPPCTPAAALAYLHTKTLVPEAPTMRTRVLQTSCPQPCPHSCHESVHQPWLALSWESAGCFPATVALALAQATKRTLPFSGQYLTFSNNVWTPDLGRRLLPSLSPCSPSAPRYSRVLLTSLYSLSYSQIIVYIKDSL